MIEYLYNNWNKSPREVGVKLDGRRVGKLVAVEGGWQYLPQGKKRLGGEVFGSLMAAKRSLESE